MCGIFIYGLDTNNGDYYEEMLFVNHIPQISTIMNWLHGNQIFMHKTRISNFKSIKYIINCVSVEYFCIICATDEDIQLFLDAVPFSFHFYFLLF